MYNTRKAIQSMIRGGSSWFSVSINKYYYRMHYWQTMHMRLHKLTQSRSWSTSWTRVWNLIISAAVLQWVCTLYTQDLIPPVGTLKHLVWFPKFLKSRSRPPEHHWPAFAVYQLLIRLLTYYQVYKAVQCFVLPKCMYLIWKIVRLP